VNEDFGSLTPLSVHPASPNLLTKHGPLMHRLSDTRATIKLTGFLTNLEFESHATALRHQRAIRCFTRSDNFADALLS